MGLGCSESTSWKRHTIAVACRCRQALCQRALKGYPADHRRDTYHQHRGDHWERACLVPADGPSGLCRPEPHQAAVYERIHEACEGTLAELSENNESDRDATVAHQTAAVRSGALRSIDEHESMCLHADTRRTLHCVFSSQRTPHLSKTCPSCPTTAHARFSIE